MRTLGHLLTGAVVFPLAWMALAALIVAEWLVRVRRCAVRTWR